MKIDKVMRTGWKNILGRRKGDRGSEMARAGGYVTDEGRPGVWRTEKEEEKGRV